jgi:hypothetical protein
VIPRCESLSYIGPAIHVVMLARVTPTAKISFCDSCLAQLQEQRERKTEQPKPPLADEMRVMLAATVDQRVNDALAAKVEPRIKELWDRDAALEKQIDLVTENL